MTPEAKDVWIEFFGALKIIVPAGITLIAGYWAGKAQLKAKIEELKKQHEFEARKTFFEYYREQQKSVQDAHANISNELATLVGLIATAHELDELTPIIKNIKEFYIRILPRWIETTKKEMKKYGISEAPEYIELTEIENSNAISPETWDVETLKTNSSELLYVFNHLRYCSEMVLEKLSERMLEPYVKNK
jgi:hypothetical protein